MQMPWNFLVNIMDNSLVFHAYAAASDIITHQGVS